MRVARVVEYAIAEFLCARERWRVCWRFVECGRRARARAAVYMCGVWCVFCGVWCCLWCGLFVVVLDVNGDAR